MESWDSVLPRRNIETRIDQLMNWLMAVERPAPKIPILMANMKIGSMTILSTAPVIIPIIPSLAFPS